MNNEDATRRTIEQDIEISDIEIGRVVSAYFYNMGDRPTRPAVRRLLACAGAVAAVTYDKAVAEAEARKELLAKLAMDSDAVSIELDGEIFFRKTALQKLTMNEVVDLIVSNK